MFESLFEISTHRYTLASTGIKTRSQEFCSRVAAERVMHETMQQYGLHIIDMYDDHHFKTYICNNGVRFYINRI